MNTFDSLLEELKEENLIEQTVIEQSKPFEEPPENEKPNPESAVAGEMPAIAASEEPGNESGRADLSTPVEHVETEQLPVLAAPEAENLVSPKVAELAESAEPKAVERTPVNAKVDSSPLPRMAPESDTDVVAPPSVAVTDSPEPASEAAVETVVSEGSGPEMPEFPTATDKNDLTTDVSETLKEDTTLSEALATQPESLFSGTAEALSKVWKADPVVTANSGEDATVDQIAEWGGTSLKALEAEMQEQFGTPEMGLSPESVEMESVSGSEADHGSTSGEQNEEQKSLDVENPVQTENEPVFGAEPATQVQDPASDAVETGSDIHRTNPEDLDWEKQAYEVPSLESMSALFAEEAAQSIDAPASVESQQLFGSASESASEAVAVAEDEYESVPETEPAGELQNEAATSHEGTIFETLTQPNPIGEDAVIPKNDNEFFRRRAMDEVTFLQMVEHVISGIEKEQLKLVPTNFDDISVSKALHSFLQVSKEGDKQKSAEAEFSLMQETQAWYYALTERDNQISVANLRRYCETTVPVLSTHAVAALARFYRNAPYSDTVRGKFDLVITRLFSKESEDGRRELLFSQDEIVAHLNELYADWRAIPAGSGDDGSDDLLAGLKFADFVEEARKADSFEDLVKNDFFNRLRSLKESVNDRFFSPFIIGSVIDSNIRIGNRYVELIEQERQKNETDALWEKYGLIIDQALSETTSKTMQLVELLNEKTDPEPVPVQKKEPKKKKKERETYKSPYQEFATKKRSRGFFHINKWLLAFSLTIIAATGGLYVWVEYYAPSVPLSPAVKKVNLENTALKQYLKAARIHEGVFYGFTEESWDSMPVEKKEEVLKTILAIGKDKGYKKVQLMDQSGKNNGFATEEKILANE